MNGKKPELIVVGVLKLNGFESHYLRLHRIYQRVAALVEQYLPDELAIEAPFFGKNVQSITQARPRTGSGNGRSPLATFR